MEWVKEGRVQNKQYKEYQQQIRQMIKTTQLASPHSKPPDHPLNERDILHAIDLCPQIIKEDKLFIRNKIKQIFKDYQLQDMTLPNDCVELLQIFHECAKPLGKIHLFENHWHWLQVKLRKYVATQKKKYKEECLNQFKRDKYQESNKKYRMMEKRIKHQDCYSRDSRKKDLKASINESEYKMDSSQEHKRSLSPNLFQESKRLNNTSRNRCLSGNLSPNFQKMTQFFGPQTCKNVIRNSESENQDWNRITKPQPSKPNLQKFANKTTGNKSSNIGQFFQSKDSRAKQRTKFKLDQPQILKKSTIYKQSTTRLPQKQPHHESTKNARKGLTVQNFSSIREQNQAKTYRNNLNPVSSFSDHGNQHIFTSPQLLAECRKFIKNTQSHSKSIPDSIYSINQDMKSSTDIFQKIDYANYNSPQFCQPKLDRFSNPKEMLKHIFRKDWSVYLSNMQKQALIQRCPEGYEQIVPLLIDQLQRTKNFLNFVQIYPILIRQLRITFTFSNIFVILDVDCKGTVDHSDFQSFLTNFQNCPIDPNILSQLQQKLSKLEELVDQVFGKIQIKPGYFEYLQLMERKQIYQLGQILQMFEFQIDSSSKMNTFEDQQ